MIDRAITPVLISLFGQYPFVTVTGPRQAGKTTLCRAAFPSLKYVNLEAPDQRDFAETDPRGFLAHVGPRAILDEIQRVPSLLSYLQVIADEAGETGLFVLTGSENFKLSDEINQSLAGRTALLRLLPFSLAERLQANPDGSVEDLLYSGFYPRIFDHGLEPVQAYADYFETYVERDLRRIGAVRNLSSFRRFVRLCAGRVGQLTHLSALGADAGVSHVTAREWLTLLEASYIVFLLQPYHGNIRKRLVKTPKLYFHDVGLACHLLGIEQAQQIATHPLRGPLFENLVVSEALKHRFNQGRSSNISFFRDSRGLECDLLYRSGERFAAVEIKSGATVTSHWFSALGRMAELVPAVSTKVVVYGGVQRQSRSAGEVVSAADFEGLLERFEAEEELAAWVQDRADSGTAVTGFAVLDRVYRQEIRPVVEALEKSLREELASFFRRTSLRSFVRDGDDVTSSQELLRATEWERTKEQVIATRDFALRDDLRLELGHEVKLQGYAQGGSAGFDLAVSIVWRFGAAEFRREATFDGTQIPEVAVTMSYSALEDRAPSPDPTVAAILRRATAELKRRSRN